MKIKLLLFFGAFFSFFAVKAQTCGTHFSAKQMNSHFELMSSGAYQAHDTCLNKKLSIVFHIVLDSNNAPGVTPADLVDCIDKLNLYFKRICITFMNCSTNYIPNYNYNEWQDVEHEPPVFANYYVDSTINIYLVESIVTPGGAAGYAYGPGGADVIVIQKSGISDMTPVHEMGHFFGLPHTFEGPGPGLVSTELVSGANCLTTGDGFCDTEADPYPTGDDINAPCNFIYGPVDAGGNYYVPPVDNIMTYFKNCRCRFTQQQYNHMAYTYYTVRNYLH